MTDEEQMINDIGKHFAERLHTLVSDTVQISLSGEVDDKEIFLTILTGLMQKVTEMCQVVGMDQRAFTHMTEVCFRHGERLKKEARR